MDVYLGKTKQKWVHLRSKFIVGATAHWFGVEKFPHRFPVFFSDIHYVRLGDMLRV